MSLTKLPLGRNNSVMTSLFPPRESLEVTSRIPGWGRETREPFFMVYCTMLSRIISALSKFWIVLGETSTMLNAAIPAWCKTNWVQQVLHRDNQHAQRSGGSTLSKLSIKHHHCTVPTVNTVLLSLPANDKYIASNEFLTVRACSRQWSDLREIDARLDLFKKLGMIWKNRNNRAEKIWKNPRDNCTESASPSEQKSASFHIG
jgi:hypothetical protein